MSMAEAMVVSMGWRIAAVSLGIPVSALALVSIPEKALTSLEAMKKLWSMYYSATIEQQLKKTFERAGEEYALRFLRLDGLTDNELHEAYLAGVTSYELFVVQRYSKLERDRLVEVAVAASNLQWRSRLSLILSFGYTSGHAETIEAVLNMAAAKKKIQWGHEGKRSDRAFAEKGSSRVYGPKIKVFKGAAEDNDPSKDKFYLTDAAGLAELRIAEDGMLMLYRDISSETEMKGGRELQEFKYVRDVSQALERSCGVRDNLALSCTLVSCLSDHWSKDYIKDITTVVEVTRKHIQSCWKKVHVNDNVHMRDEDRDRRAARSLIVYNNDQRAIIHNCRGQQDRQSFLANQFELKELQNVNDVINDYTTISATELFRGADEYDDIVYKVGIRIKERAAQSDVQPKDEEKVKHKFSVNEMALFRRYSRKTDERTLLSGLKKYLYYYNVDDDAVSILSPANKACFNYSRQTIDIVEEEREQPFFENSGDIFMTHVSRMLFTEYKENTNILRDDDVFEEESKRSLREGIHKYLQLKGSRLTWLANDGARLTVSGVRTTAEAVTRITGTRTAWIVREILVAMHRRGIAVQECYPTGCSFGDTIVALYRRNIDESAKAISYDEEVDLAGCRYQIDQGGKIELVVDPRLDNGCRLVLEPSPQSREMARAALLEEGRGRLQLAGKTSTLRQRKNLGTVRVC